MKAIVLNEYGGPDKLHYVTDAAEPQIGERDILVLTTATSINPVDFKIRNGSAQGRFPQQFPTILGRDLSGIVQAVGREVRSFKPGDRIAAFTGRTYAEKVAVREDAATHIPDGVDLVEAAAYPLVCLTADQLIRRATKLEAKQTVLITGALGSVGRAAVHVAKKLGATVIAGVRKKHLDQAAGIGADSAVAIDDEESLKQLGLVDAMADTIGGEVATKLLAKVKQGGVVGTVVTPQPDMTLHPTLQMNHIFTTPDASKLREFLDDVRDHTFQLPIDRMIPLEKAAEGQVAAEKGGIGKIILMVL